MNSKDPHPLFRKEAWEHFSSPEQLDQRIKIIHPRSWIVLACIALLASGALFWALFGEIPHTLSVKAIYLNAEGFAIIENKFEGAIEEIYISAGDYVSENQPLASIKTKEEKKWEAKSPVSGKVIEIVPNEGSFVEIDEKLFIINKTEGDFLFFTFLPLELSQQLKVGMGVHLKITGIETEKYGQMIGKIGYISPYIISLEHLVKMLGNENLVAYFTKNRPVVEVAIIPQKNASTTSGYAWTSPTGPPKKIEPTVIAEALITLYERKTISYVIPLWPFELH
jgi:hypothetical protein